MNSKANNLLSFSNAGKKIIGVQFANKLGRSNNFEFKFLTSPFTYTDNYFTRTKLTFTDNPTNPNQFNSNESSNLTDDSARLVSKIPFIKGCGVARLELETFQDTGADDNGLYFGLTDQDPSTFTNILTPQQRGIYIAVKRIGSGKVYEVVRFDSSSGGFITTTSSVLVAVGDKLEIARNGGNLEFCVYEKANADPNKRHVIYSQADDNLNRFVYAILRSNVTNLRIQNLRIQLKSRALSLKQPNTLNDHPLVFSDSLGAVVPRPSPSTKTLNEVIVNKSFGEFLGYDMSRSNVINNNIASQEMFYEAQNLFNPAVFNDTYVIVLDNIPLESYDGFEGTEKSVF